MKDRQHDNIQYYPLNPKWVIVDLPNLVLLVNREELCEANDARLAGAAFERWVVLERVNHLGD